MAHDHGSEFLPALASPPCAMESSPGIFGAAEADIELSVDRTFDGATVFITGTRRLLAPI